MKHLLTFLRHGVSGTLASTVGSPSFDRRGTMLKHYAFMLLFLLGSLNVWGDNILPKLYLTSKNTPSGNTGWTFTNAACNNAKADYWKMIQSASEVISPEFNISEYTSVTVKVKWQNFGTFDASKSNATIKVSTALNTWKTIGTTGLTAAGTTTVVFDDVETSSSYSKAQIKISTPNADGSLGGRLFSVEIIGEPAATGGTSKPTLSADPVVIDFGTVEQGASVAAKTVAVTYANLTGSVTYSGLSDAFAATGTISASGDEITITPSTATIGEHEQTLTIQSTADSKSQDVTVTMNVVAPFDGLKLTFDVSSNPGEWPTDNSTTTTNYTYTLNEVDYTFALNNVKCNSGYLMLTSVAKLGLPAISGYKLVKVEATNSGGCSTSTQVSVSISDASKTDVTGGDAQTWGTTNTKYTYNLSKTEENTMYYLWIANKNCQLVTLELYYEKVAAAAVAKPTISGETPFLTSTTVTISHAEADAIYYTTNGDDPTTSSTEYSVPFEVNATTTIKAIAVKGEDVSAVAEMTFTKATILTVAQAKTAIDAGGDLSNKYVAGIVSQIDSYNSSYNSLTYWISDDGTTANQLQVYSGLAGVVKNQFASEDDIHVGDDVTVKGTLKKYSSTYEFDKNNVIVAYKPIALLSWSAASYDAELGGSNSFPTLTNTNSVSVTYSSSNTDAATINATTGEISLVAEGSTTIKATFAGNENYKANAVSYTLKVKNAITRADISFEENGGSEVADLTQQTNLPNPLPVITKAGKNFGGWFTDSELETPAVAGAAVTSTVAITLYAKWLDPYTVAEALDIIDGYGDNETSEANVYVAGIISSVDSYNSTYKSITYYISVDGTTTGQLQVYSGKGLNGADFIGEDDLQKGDNVIVYGELKKYVKNTTVTPEVNQNSQLYYFNRPTVDLVSIALPATASVKVGKTTPLTPVFDPENATDKVVSWASENASIATVDNGVVTGVSAGTVNITVTYVADPTINATCAVTVSEPLSFNDPNYEWQLVTSDAQLVAGKYYVIGSASEGKTANKTITSGYLGNVASTIADGAIAYDALGENTAIFELGGESGAWTLVEAIEEKQLTGATTANLVWDGATNTTWPISIDGENAIIGASDGYRVLYNVNSPRFKPYNSATNASMLLPQLYVWAEKVYKLRYDANGGKNAPAAQAAVAGEATVTDAKPTYTDHIFNGWNTLVGGDGEAKAAGDVIDLSEGDVTLYAQWRTPENVTVSYDANGGEGTMEADENQTEGSLYTIKDNEFTREGYNFTGWKAYDANDVELTITNGKFIVPATNVTVKAQWGVWTATDFVLVTDKALLKDGDKVYIVAAEYERAMGTQNTNYRNEVAIQKAGSSIKVMEGAEPVELTLGKNGDNFTFKDGTGYLYAAGTATSKENYMNTKTDADAACNWTITIDENGTEIKSVENDKTPFMQYNPGSTRFSCYSTASQQAVVLYKKENAEPAYETVRSGLEVNRYYTVCLPKKVTAIKGASFWTLNSKSQDGAIAYLEEETNNLPFAAGKPFIIQATAAQLEVVYEGTATEEAGTNGALHGTLVYMNAAALAAAGSDVYMLFSNELRPVGENNHLDANRAYVRLSELHAVDEAPQSAPGRRVRAMPMQPQVATGFEAAEANEAPRKVLINGELFIFRGEKMYDAKGQLVK